MADRYQNILVAVDGSKQADTAFEEAVAVAKRNEAQLNVLYVNEVSGNFFGDFTFTSQKVAEELTSIAENKVQEYVNRSVELGLTDIHPYVMTGYPKALIVSFDETDTPIDLIIVGATGLNAVERVLVGSTASYVVNHAPCTVMVVK